MSKAAGTGCSSAFISASINRETYMIVSIDAETIFSKMYNLSLIKTLRKLSLARNILIEIKVSIGNQQLMAF